MKLRQRRLRNREPAELNITAFMNLMVILVPFLLITAVFSRMAILELNVPAPSSEPTPPSEKVQLEVIVRVNAIEVADQRGGLIRRIVSTEEGHDVQALNQLMQELKARFPDKRDVNVLLEPDIAYDTLVQVMDAVRVARVMRDDKLVQAELFPQVSVGDAPASSATAMLGKGR